MADLVEAAMRAGAFGLSSGLIYVPGTYARTDELTALAKVAARHGGVYASHIRNENDAVLEALDEALTIARDAEVAVHIAHVKCSGWPNHGRAGGVLARLGAARAGGLRVTADQYAYDASSTGIDVWFPDVELAAGREALGRRLASDAAFRDRVREALFRKMDQTGFGDFAFGRIANAKGNEDLNGLPMDAAAAKRFGSSDRHAQAELAMDLFAAAAPSRVDMVFHSMAERDVERFLAVDWIAVASDASIRAEQSVARPHPRGAGNTVRVLGRYVRERGVLDLPTAIRKLTSVPARIFGLEDRGELRVGAFADVVVFDAAQVADQATYTEPLRPPVGIAWVLVNGSLVVDHGTMTGVRTGMVLRRGPRKPA
jgi:N-acyl-D-amino-acid deacylase